MRIWILLVLLVVCPTAQAQPAQILLIRHAEKPDGPSIDLSPQGQERAKALPALFAKGTFPKPDFLFATRKSKHSNRPIETVTPLAAALQLKIDARFADDQYDQLAAELLTNPRYAGKTVLICWHHGKLPELAQALKAADVPDHWKDDVFDKIWVITYENGQGKLKKRNQALLPGDQRD